MYARCVVIGLGLLAAAGALAQDAAPTLDEAFQNLPTYTMGDDYHGLEIIRVEVSRVHGNPAAHDALEDRLVAVLDGESTPDAKLFVCRQLLVMGTARSVPALTRLLNDPATSDEARYALERMSASEAGAALRDALNSLSGTARIGTINSLGVRQDSEATATLAALLDDGDLYTAHAAAEALTRIGGVAACDALRGHLSAPRAELRHACEDGVLACAERLLAAGDNAGASTLYESLYAPDMRDAVRVAAFLGMAEARPDDAAALVNSALMGDDAPVALAALRFIRSGAVAAEIAAEWLFQLSAERKALAIHALADLDDPAAMPAIIQCVRHPENDDVLCAALEALGNLGDKSAIPVLARAAVESDGDVADIARESLARLQGEDINRIMMTAARAGSNDIKKVLIQALGARQASEVAPDLIAAFASNHGKPEVRLEAFRALAKIAEPELLDDLVDIVVAAKKDEVQIEAKRAVVATAARAAANEKTRAILEALPKANKPIGRAALIDVLGRLGDPSGLEAVRTALNDADEDVRAAAVNAMSAWPDEAVMEDLAGLAANAEHEAWREVAFGGYVRLIRSNSERGASATIDFYRNALQLASQPGQVKLVMAGLGEVPDMAALELVKPHLDNPEVSTEARIAYDRIRRSQFAATASQNPGAAMHALDNDPRTRWDTGAVQAPGQWFQIDLTEPAEIARIVLDCQHSSGDFPRAYQVYVGQDPENLGEPVVSGEGSEGITTIVVPNVPGRYIRIVQTGSSSGNFWSIHELTVETN